MTRLDRLMVAAFALAALGGCSSASGDGDKPPRDHSVIVVPPGTAVVCQDGNPPPCNP